MVSDMILQWITFAVMILIQAVAAAAVISSMRATLASYGVEIKSLRDWRHEMAPKAMLISDHGETLRDHEGRLRVVEKDHGMFHIEDCPYSKECPLRRGSMLGIHQP